MKQYIGWIACLLLLASCSNHSSKQRTFKRVEHTEKGIKVITNQGIYLFNPYSDHTMETSFVPKGEKYDPLSYAVVTNPQSGIALLSLGDSVITYSTSGIAVHIRKKPFGISYFYQNRPLVSEGAGYVKTDSTEEIHFNITPDEALLGGGERVLGMNRRGHRLTLYNKADYGYGTHSELMNFCLPIVISSRNYAIHFDNPQIGHLDLDSHHNNTLTYETLGGRMTYQVIAGNDWEALPQAYTQLTGRQPLIPRWALGNFASRFGYHSEKQVRAVVNKFQKDGVPLDAIVLDLYWFGKDIKGQMGNLAFNTDSFPQPQQMMCDLQDQGVKTILVTEPFILTTSKRWKEASEQNILCTDSLGKPYTYDFYFGHTGLLDIFKPRTKQWFWDIYKDLVLQGVSGWWGDLGEPEVHPSSLHHVNGLANQVHNIYGNEWAKTIAQGYAKDFPDLRPFILMRAGYAGSQHWGMIPWTGDVSRSWEGLQGQMELSLQMGLQGMAFTHSDLGGFAGDSDNPELYRRWLQYGVFQPIFRPHGQEAVASEVIYKDSYTQQVVKKAIQFRYQLMPYNYTLAFENHTSGLPLMRPMDYNTSSTYLWGNNLLVSPIVKSQEVLHAVHFPSGARWFDYYTGKCHAGGSTDSVATSPDYIPLFIRGGSFITTIPTIQNTSTYSLKNLNIHYVYDASIVQHTDSIYNDDGCTPNAYEKEAYEMLYLKSNTSSDSLAIDLHTVVGCDFVSDHKHIDLLVSSYPQRPSQVLLNNKPVSFTWNDNTQSILVKIDLALDAHLMIH